MFSCTTSLLLCLSSFSAYSVHIFIQCIFIKFYLDVLDVLEKKADVTGAYSKNKALNDFKTVEETFCGHKCIIFIFFYKPYCCHS